VDGRWEFHETDSYGWLCIFDGRTTNRKTENIDFLESTDTQYAIRRSGRMTSKQIALITVMALWFCHPPRRNY
jgi:hypothetical protein